MGTRKCLTSAPAIDNYPSPRRYTTDMKTNPTNFSRMIAMTLAVIAVPSLAQEAPKPEAPKGEPRNMRQAGERMQPSATPNAPKPWRIGLMVEPIDPALRNHLDIPEKSGVVVTQCLDQGPAGKAGIKKNDIILSANGRSVGSIEPLRESVEVAAKTGKELRLSVMTKGVRRDVVIKPELPKPPTPQNSERPMPRMREISPPPAVAASESKLREHEQMIRRLAEQNKELMTRLERQQGEMKRTNEAIEQLNKAVREMKQQLKEADK